MESQHVPNPWQHQPQKQDLYDNHDNQRYKATSLTDAEATSLEDFFQGHKQVFYQSQLLLQQLQQRQRQLKTQGQGAQKGEPHEKTQTERDDDDETDSQRTAWSQLGINSPMNLSSSTLADTDTSLTPVAIYMTDSDFGDGDEVRLLITCGECGTWKLEELPKKYTPYLACYYCALPSLPLCSRSFVRIALVSFAVWQGHLLSLRHSFSVSFCSHYQPQKITNTCLQQQICSISSSAQFSSHEYV
jgi:hypothetical protein